MYIVYIMMYVRVRHDIGLDRFRVLIKKITEDCLLSTRSICIEDNSHNMISIPL